MIVPIDRKANNITHDTINSTNQCKTKELRTELNLPHNILKLHFTYCSKSAILSFGIRYDVSFFLDYNYKMPHAEHHQFQETHRSRYRPSSGGGEEKLSFLCIDHHTSPGDKKLSSCTYNFYLYGTSTLHCKLSLLIFFM